MKKIKLFILLIFPFSVFAQQDIADYEKFEVLAKKINSIQRTADGNTVKSNETDVLLNIPETNFLFNYHNQSATNINKVEDGLLVYENIDLADVNGIGILDESFGSCGMIIISTNKKQNFTVIVDGIKENHEIESIAFYFPFSERAKGNEMYNALAELILLSKVKKGILTESNVSQLQKKWKDVEFKNKAEDYYQFWNNEPDNIFTDLAYYRLSKLDRSFELENLKTGNFYLGMSDTDFNSTIKNKMYSYSATNSSMEKYKYNRISFTAYDQFRINPITNSDYNFIIDDLSSNKKEKYATEITEFNKFATESLNNELASILGGNYKISIPYAYWNNKERKVNFLQFWFEPIDGYEIDFLKIATKMYEKYGVGEFSTTTDSEKSQYIANGISNIKMIISYYKTNKLFFITIESKKID